MARYFIGCARSLALAAVMLSASSSGLLAQERVPSGVPSVEAALECFVQMKAYFQRTCPGVVPAHVISAFPHKFPAATVDSVLDGLERLALSADSMNVRSAAVFSIARLDRTDRLVRIYERSDSSPMGIVVRGAVVLAVRDHGERNKVVAFLESVAAENVRPEEVGYSFGPARVAIETLYSMGEEAALRRLHGSGSVTNPDARLLLVHIAEHSFRWPERDAARARMPPN